MGLFSTPSRSREGAWIEMVIAATTAWIFMVAPVRERGLKLRPSHGSHMAWSRSWPALSCWRMSNMSHGSHMAWSRSREGAWIEIGGSAGISLASNGRSREGAWIEIIKVDLL